MFLMPPNCENKVVSKLSLKFGVMLIRSNLVHFVESVHLFFGLKMTRLISLGFAYKYQLTLDLTHQLR
eukprot:m.271629 g.271629  ORF g.271629 m.271629 type:complete len:68 (+) comp96724_c0_seq1:1154-1357(+)